MWTLPNIVATRDTWNTSVSRKAKILTLSKKSQMIWNNKKHLLYPTSLVKSQGTDKLGFFLSKNTNLSNKRRYYASLILFIQNLPNVTGLFDTDFYLEPKSHLLTYLFKNFFPPRL